MVTAAPALGALAAFAAMCFLVFLYYAYGFSLGALLQMLANFFRSIGFSLGWFGHISLAFIGNGIDDVDHAIRTAIGHGIIATRGAGLYCWHYLAYAIRQVGDAIAELAEENDQALEWLVNHTLPSFIASRLLHPLATIEALGKTVAHTAATLPRVITHEIAHTKPAVVHEAVAASTAIALPGLKQIEREQSDLAKWIRSHAKLLTVGGIVSLVGATIFKEFKLGWLRCRGVNKVGKALCGASGLIETLFADAIDALVVSDLCQVISAMSYAAKQFEPVLIGFVDLEDALIGCRGATKPELLNVPALSLPPVTGYVLA